MQIYKEVASNFTLTLDPYSNSLTAKTITKSQRELMAVSLYQRDEDGVLKYNMNKAKQGNHVADYIYAMKSLIGQAC